MTQLDSTATGAAAPDAHEHRLAKRAIGFPGALAMSIAAMGPLLGALGVAPLIVSQAGFRRPSSSSSAGSRWWPQR
jgi:hypothetical protein